MHRSLFLFGFLAFSVSADEAHDAKVIKELLKLHAPPPDWRMQLSDPNFLKAIDRRPAEDAADDELAECWRETPSSTSPPSRQSQLRLTEICARDPEQLPYLLRWLTKTDREIGERLKTIYDRIATSPPKNFDPSPLHDWLMENTPYFRDELIAKTRETFSGAGAETLRDAVKTLARLDARAAEELLRSLAKSENDFTRTAALVALLEFDGTVTKSERESWHAELRRIATDTAASGRARDYAIVSVMRKPWPGDEEWFPRLFEDASLTDLRFGDQRLAPLYRVVSDQPGRWVPALVAMINASDRTKHGNAALCLTGIPQGEALRPLLPWLSDASWSPVGGDAARRRLLWNLAKVELPEAVPGLITMLQHTDPWLVEDAAAALAHQNAKEAGPALREALNRIESSHSYALAPIAVRLGAFTVTELVQYLELSTRRTATSEERPPVDQAIDTFRSDDARIPLLVGGQVERNPPRGSDLVNAALQRADELGAKEPALADRLRTVVAGWSDPAAVAATVQRLRSGDFTGRWLAKLMEPADPLLSSLVPAGYAETTARKRVKTTAIAEIEGLSGLALGVQSAMTGVGVEAVLSGNDRSAILALLASARLTRTSLPLSAVAPLLESADPLQTRAVEAYLISEDTPQGRELVLRRHPGEIRILGATNDFAPEGEKTWTEQLEERFQEWFRKPDAPQEVFGLLSSGTWGGAGDRAVVILPGEVRFNVYDGPGRRRRRILAAEETAKFRKWITAHRVDELAPFDQGALDGVQYNYIHLTPDGGRRVYMNNPPGGDPGIASIRFGPGLHDPDPWIYGRLVERFIALERASMDVVYDELEKLPGYYLAHRREDGAVQKLYSDGQQLLAEIFNLSTGDMHWRAVEEEGLSKATVPAPASSLAYERRFAREDFFIDREQSPDFNAGRLKDGFVWPGTRQRDHMRGLWFEPESGDPELIAHGRLNSPVITPDGEWLVASKGVEETWSVVRIHFGDWREEPVDLPPADSLAPVAWVAAHGKVLIYRAKGERVPDTVPTIGPDTPEYYLLDAATGQITRVTGDFRPYHNDLLLTPEGLPLGYQERADRRMQSANAGDEVWAALPSPFEEAPETIVGRYNTRTFKFVERLKVPGIRFSSSAMWVEETKDRFTFIANGDILRLTISQ